MSLTRKFLTTLGIEEDKAEEIMSKHLEVVDSIKDERDTLKSQAKDNSEALEKLKSENKELKDALSTTDSEWKEKYDGLKSEYDGYKNDVETKAARQTKIDAFKKILKEAKVSERRIDTIAKVSGDIIDGIEFEEDGTVKDSEKITDGIKEEWSEFIETEGNAGSNVATPPKNGNGGNGSTGRAAELARQYHERTYGAKEE